MNEKASFKTVGIIGGLGPDATSRFYMDLVAKFRTSNEPIRPSVLTYSVPIPLSVERNAVLNGESKVVCRDIVVQAATRLEGAGADFIVMPCNSLHIFTSNIRGSVHVPFVDMVEEVASLLADQGASVVGLVSTRLTAETGLYKNSLAEKGMSTINLDCNEQEEIDNIIYRAINNANAEQDKTGLAKVVEELVHKGATSIVIACTDLKPLMPEYPTGVRCYDSMEVLLDTTVRILTEKECPR